MGSGEVLLPRCAVGRRADGHRPVRRVPGRAVVLEAPAARLLPGLALATPAQSGNPYVTRVLGMVLVLPEAGSAQQALGIVHWFLKLPPQRATGVRIDFPP